MNVISRQINLMQWNRISKLLLLFLLMITLFIIPMLRLPLSSSPHIKEAAFLNKTLEDLDILIKQNLELRKMLTNLQASQKEVLDHFQQYLIKAEKFIRNDKIGYVAQMEDPSTQYEMLRRRISSNIRELSFFINSEIAKLQKQVNVVAPALLPSLKHILDLSSQHIRWLLSDMDNLAEADGYATWRKEEANKLSSLVQTRLHYLQNPHDCKRVKKVVCSLDVYCGFGCQLHHIIYCFMVAYGTQRTLILQYQEWQPRIHRWEEFFRPISDTCIDAEEDSFSYWPEDAKVLVISAVDLISSRPPYLPLAIPKDLAPRLIQLHGSPIVWWIGQFLSYFVRPQEKLKTVFKNAIENFDYKRPIVGVHVRRTDKIDNKEASYHGIEEYMSVVDEYYKQLELKEIVDKRRVYLATDDPKVITEASNKYLDYEILSDQSIPKTANVFTRDYITSLQGIILDVHMLSTSDFLVCTFSSGLCRLAYEIMQNYFPDASSKFRSLDDIYYFHGQSPHIQTAVMAHGSYRSDEIQLKRGDLVHIQGNHWNGYSEGRNLRTNQTGLFPSFKTQDKVEIAKFPTYSQIYYYRYISQSGLS